MLEEEPPFERLPDFVFKKKKGKYRGLDLARHATVRDGDECWYCGLPFWHGHPFLRRSLEHFVPKHNRKSNTRLLPNLPETTCVAHAVCNTTAGHQNLPYRYNLRERYREDPSVVLSKADRLLTGMQDRIRRRLTNTNVVLSINKRRTMWLEISRLESLRAPTDVEKYLEQKRRSKADTSDGSLVE